MKINDQEFNDQEFIDDTMRKVKCIDDNAKKIQQLVWNQTNTNINFTNKIKMKLLEFMLEYNNK